MRLGSWPGAPGEAWLCFRIRRAADASPPTSIKAPYGHGAPAFARRPRTRVLGDVACCVRMPSTPSARRTDASGRAPCASSYQVGNSTYLLADGFVEVPPQPPLRKVTWLRQAGQNSKRAPSADAHVAREPHRWRIATLPRPWTVAGAKTAHGCARELPKASIACSSSQRARRAK